LSNVIIDIGRTFDKIIGWTALGFLVAGVIGYYYLAYGDDIAKTMIIS
jgi:hypothetical protein